MSQFKNIKKIYLASGSPRRIELIANLGLPFEVVKVQADESCTSDEPEKAAREIAISKLSAALGEIHPGEGEVVLTADTSVWIDGKMFGKPRDRQDAADMLRQLSGRTHQVITGVAIGLMQDKSKSVAIHAFDEVTHVSVAELTEEEIGRYIDTGEPMDKAGAYGIQKFFTVFVDRIEGDYFNVVGLPLAAIYRKLCIIDKEMGT